jgi:Na+/H+-dicarboxylate symporter
MACTSIIHRRLFYFVVSLFSIGGAGVAGARVYSLHYNLCPFIVVSLFSIGGAGVAGARVYSLHYNLCPFIVHDKVLGTD